MEIDAEVPDVIIYLGPSLSQSEAEEILPAGPEVQYCPPVRRGDLAGAIAAAPRIIGIIDGLFFENAAVGHREILGALKAGILVVGSSSMGALRAAELSPFGMEGIGEVYRRYQAGLIESDDEVALICDPVSNMALSEALVNIRITLEKALSSGVIDEEEHSALLQAAQHQYYPDRTWPQVIRGASLPSTRTDAILLWVRASGVDQKQDDARAALRYIASRMNRQMNSSDFQSSTLS
ncbi:MAG: TfuA-related McrA-glycine thioamidation protein [Methanospirillum sp.]|nr:TfuA-related McrA-glycine thioamidation protein [Methanospirillum sp.]